MMIRKPHGYSIIELTIVLFICSVLAMLGLLSLSRARSSGELKRVARELLQIIETSAEIGRNMNVTVDISYQQQIHSVIVRSSLATPLILNKSLLLPDQINVQTARFANPTKANAVLTIRPTGTATPGRFVLIDAKNNSCEIVQALRGLRTLIC